MNAENFSTYLAQPAKLYQLPYQEIKNLVAEYPYSANLRRLLLLKSKIEHDPKFEQYLHDLASSTMDRRRLYEFVTNEIPQLLDLDTEPEERLELQDLTLVREKDKVPVLREDKEQEEAVQAVTPPPIIADTLSDEEDEIIEGESSPAVVVEFESSAPATEPLPESIAAIAPIAETKPTPTEEAKEEKLTPPYRVPSHLLTTIISGSLIPGGYIKPQPKSHFRSWQALRTGPTRDWQALRRRHTSEGDAPKAREVAKQSVQDPTNLASETLAKLLARQGQYRKAIKIYQRLSLLYPEKSRYFAATIEELKQKL